jgi:hypothetical protein
MKINVDTNTTEYIYVNGRRDEEGNALGNAGQFMKDLKDIMDKNNIEEFGCSECDPRYCERDIYAALYEND